MSYWMVLLDGLIGWYYCDGLNFRIIHDFFQKMMVLLDGHRFRIFHEFFQKMYNRIWNIKLNDSFIETLQTMKSNH